MAITKKELRRCRELHEAYTENLKYHIEEGWGRLAGREASDVIGEEALIMLPKLCDEIDRLRHKVAKLKAANVEANDTIRRSMNKYDMKFYENWLRRLRNGI